MADNNSPPPLMTDKELLMEGGAYSEIMAAAFEYADACCSSGDEPRRYKAAIDNLRKTVRAEIARFSRGNYKAPQPQVVPAGGVSNEDVQDLVSLALRKAWQLGQTYWQQADSEFISQQNKSDATQAKFQVLIDETRAALATTQPAATVNQQLTAESSAPAGEYPALPEATTWLIERSAFRVSPHGQDAESNEWLEEAHEPGEKGSFAVYTEQQLKAFADATHAMRAGEQKPVADDYPHEQMDALALARYKVVPSDQSMYLRHAVVAGDGQQHLYNGSEVDCQNMARKFAGAFLDGAFAFHERRTAPQAQPSDALDAETTKKAARYDWLRSGNDYQSDGPMVVLYESEGDRGDRPYWSIASDALDASIDAAMAAAQDKRRILYTSPVATQGEQADTKYGESAYQRGYRHGYNRRDAEVQGALL